MPTGPKYEIKKFSNNVKYLYYRVKSIRNNEGKLKHERYSIGKVVYDDQLGVEYLNPNEKYYELFDKKYQLIR